MNNMQATNKPSPQKSRCMYCGSLSRGKGCRHGPHGVHFHPDDSTKCSYCGSPSYGRGCKHNPNNDMHVHGVSYNNMFRETIQSFLDNQILIKELKKPFTQFDAFKLGLINETGQKIKSPITEEETNSVSPLIKTIIKIKKFLGPKVDLIEASELLKETTANNKLGVSRYNKVAEHKSKISDVVNDLYRVLDEAKNDGLTLEEVANLVKA